MADQSIPTQYPNTPATTTGPVPGDRQPAFVQETHPSTTSHGPVPELEHASDRDPDDGQ